MKKSTGSVRGYFTLQHAVYVVVAMLVVMLVAVLGFVVMNTTANTASAKVVVTSADKSVDSDRVELWEASSNYFVSMLSVARNTNESVASYGKVTKKVSVSLNGYKKTYEVYKKKDAILVVEQGSTDSKVKISGEEMKKMEYWLGHGTTKDTSFIVKLIAK